MKGIKQQTWNQRLIGPESVRSLELDLCDVNHGCANKPNKSSSETIRSHRICRKNQTTYRYVFTEPRLIIAICYPAAMVDSFYFGIVILESNGQSCNFNRTRPSVCVMTSILPARHDHDQLVSVPSILSPSRLFSLAGAIYGSIAFFLSILHNIFVLYHVDAFVSIYKIDKTSFWIGETIFLFWNCVNDPLFGWLSDGGYLSARESTRSSSSAASSSSSRTLRRRWSSEEASRSAPIGNDIGIDEEVVLARVRALAWSGPALSISFALLWVQWSRPSLQFAVCLCLYDGFLTLVDLHHSALLADLDVGHAERTKLNSWCSFFSGLGSVSGWLLHCSVLRNSRGLKI